MCPTKNKLVLSCYTLPDQMTCKFFNYFGFLCCQTAFLRITIEYGKVQVHFIYTLIYKFKPYTFFLQFLSYIIKYLANQGNKCIKLRFLCLLNIAPANSLKPDKLSVGIACNLNKKGECIAIFWGIKTYIALLFNDIRFFLLLHFLRFAYFDVNYLVLTK